jgi:hypothetical protein
VLGNIARAAKAWYEGDDILAYIHLAHAHLGELEHPRDAVQRLAIVDGFLKAGCTPRAILEALKVDSRYVDALEKDYNPAEPRVPAGGGRTSGQWTRDGGASSAPPLSYLAPGAASWLGDLAPSAATSLGEYALSLLSGSAGAVAAFGLIFIPSNKNVGVEGDIEGMPGLRYSWNPDERGIHLTYDSVDGGHNVLFAPLDKDDVFRDGQGRAIGRVLPGDMIALDPAAISSDLVQDDEPRLCPAPAPDKPNETGREYENYIKALVNPPPDTTPSGIGYQLPNPEDFGKLVFYDDCEHETGMMVDAKGPGYAGLLMYSVTMQSVVYEWLDEGSRQILASDGRDVRWYFAEKTAADFARELFRDYDGGLERIDVKLQPWSGKRQ